mmetsp:Transcript_2673/g.4341  ORF Transcript_2673/g.4341 Transcript_2673/m.4341 type:complete len:82 (+) Transcript_2673:111-356(+)
MRIAGSSGAATDNPPARRALVPLSARTPQCLSLSRESRVWPPPRAAAAAATGVRLNAVACSKQRLATAGPSPSLTARAHGT